MIENNAVIQVGFWTIVPKGKPSHSYRIDLYTSIKYNRNDSIHIKLTPDTIIDRNGDTIMQNAIAIGLVSDAPLVFPIRSNEIFSVYWVDSNGVRKNSSHQNPNSDIVDTVGNF